jgi:hypothetical protein
MPDIPHPLTERWPARTIAAVERDNKMQAAEMREHNERLDAADRERTRFTESAQKEHNDTMLIRVTLFGVLVTLIVGSAGFWAVWEARQTRINDERPFIGFDSISPQSNGHLTEDSDPQMPRIVNLGKSPARKVQAVCYGAAPESPEKTWDDVKKLEKSEYYDYLLPQHTQTLICRGATLVPIPAPASTNIHYLGLITYEDEDGRRYQTPFCQNILFTTAIRAALSLADECLHSETHLPELR